MERMKLFIKSIAYSFSLIYRSSGFLILLYFLLNLLCATRPILSAFVLKYLLDSLIMEPATGSTALLYIGLYIMLLIVFQAMNSAKGVLYDSVFEKAEHLYDCELSEMIARLPMAIIDTSEGKDMIDDVRNTKEIAVHLSQQIVRILSLFYSFGVAFVALALFHVWFSILFLVLTVPGIILDMVFDQRADNLRRKTAPDVRKFCYYRWMLTDAWPAKDVRMYDLTEPIRERYDTEKDVYRKACKELGFKRMRISLYVELGMRSGEIIFIAFVVVCALAGDITIGDVSLYISLAASVFSSFQVMAMVFVMGYTRAAKAMGRFFDFINIECGDKEGKKRKLCKFESLVFDSVYFKYPLADEYVLTGASFVLNYGDRLSIVGINGSGKTTIIKLMLGLYEIESGQILLNGYPLSDYSKTDVRGLFSVLFQSFVQYPLTLRDNIALSDYQRVGEDSPIIDALKWSGIYDEIQMKLKSGLDSYMTREFDDEGIELSKGQWQKVALARAYFKDAPIIVFDEPSAALDAEAENRIFKNFETISNERTGIMISHRISATRMSNKIIVLDHGKIVESGTHEELVTLDGLYSKLYNLQKEKYTAKVSE